MAQQGYRPLTPEEDRRRRLARARYRKKMKRRRIFWCCALIAVLAAVIVWFVSCRQQETPPAAGGGSSSSQAQGESGASAPFPDTGFLNGDIGVNALQAEDAPAGTGGDMDFIGADIGVDSKDMQPSKIPLSWNLVLVNNTIPLPAGFTVETAAIPGGKEVDSRIVQALNDMLAAAEQDGAPLLVCSAYRSQEKQQQLLSQQIAQQRQSGLSEEEARAEAEKVVAKPGYSEHNTGLAVDIVAPDYQMLDDGYADTAQAVWLKTHAREYGFILRYPQGKEDQTGIIFEPWHYRYVGTEYAPQIEESGLSYEEWYAQHVQ
ncbi:MAG: M15 family metallopeptidase, partial [Oscillospiraceae bacterium]|nr:M15 family metallopeptidase [Oscillospiraceae bacterium]